MERETDGDRDTRPRAVSRAIEFGIDLTLLVENLKYSPTERVRRAQRSLYSMVALAEQVAAYRQQRSRRS